MADTDNAITKTHPEYDKAKPRWQRCRDAYDGEDAVKDHDLAQFPRIASVTTGQTNLQAKPGAFRLADLARFYLAPLPGHTKPEQYYSYLQRAKWFGATGRTIDALTGAVFRKAPTLESPDAAKAGQPPASIADNPQLQEWLQNVDLAGSTLEVFARNLVDEVEKVGRVGILTEWSDEQQRPFLRCYAAEQNTDWDEDMRAGAKVPVRVVLMDEFDRDEKGDAVVMKYRELLLSDANAYTVTEYTRDEGDTSTFSSADVTPSTRTGTLTEIPYVSIGSKDLQLCVQKPPLIDLINTNLHHYRVGADYYSALFKQNCPQPVVIGDDEDTHVYEIGGGVWKLPVGASAQMLECSGGSMGNYETALENDKSEMALLGARLLSPQKRQAETAEALRLQQAGETAVLTTLVRNVMAGLTQALRWAAEWAGLDGADELNVYLNTDFDVSRMPADQLLAYLHLVQAGAMSVDSFLALLYEDELFTDSVQAEKDRIEMQAPLGLTGAPPNLLERLVTVLEQLAPQPAANDPNNPDNNPQDMNP